MTAESVMLGGHSFLGLGMSSEKIEELLYSMHQSRIAEAVTSDDEEDFSE